MGSIETSIVGHARIRVLESSRGIASWVTGYVCECGAKLEHYDDVTRHIAAVRKERE